MWRGASRCRVAPERSPEYQRSMPPNFLTRRSRRDSSLNLSRATFSNYTGGRACAVRPPDDPLELEPDDDDPDEPDDPDDEPELPDRDDDAPLVVPLEEPDV